MGASAGGIQAVSTILQGIPKNFPAPIVVVQHRSPTAESFLVPILERRTILPVVEALEGETLRPGTVYVAQTDQHLTITDAGRFAYCDGQRIHHVLSSANPLFISAADVFGTGAIGVILTGVGRNGTNGVQAIKARGGVIIAQDQATSEHFDMPHSAIATGAVDYILPLEEIAPALVRVATGQSDRSPHAGSSPPA
jgi:two-component system chemotaxis response regulator CheB